MLNFDIVVIGAGPGGYVAAIRASQLGFKVAVVEKEHLGGICLNWGCIPTKALLRSAEILHYMQNAKNYGLSVEKPSFDLQNIVQRSRNISKQLSSGVAGLLKKNKVEVIDGFASITKEKNIEVKTEKDGKQTNLTIKASHIILATGARARVVPELEPDGKFIWTYKEALIPDAVPKKMLVVGSGAIGIEKANFYHAMGSEVTIVELMDRIMPVEDEEISTLAKKSFEKQGIKILTQTKIASIKKNSSDMTVVLEDTAGEKTEVVVNKILSAVGTVANLENIGLENTKIQIKDGRVVVDDFSQTHEKGIYAIGDITQGPWLAHKASHEGIICVEKIAGKNPHTLDRRCIPGCTYSNPQVASVGLTEKAAKEKGYEVKIGRFPFLANGKALALGESEGLIKTVFCAKTGELLGAHMIGAEVTELIQGFVISMNLETTEEDLMHTVFAHPTLSEMMHESVLNAFGKTIHF